MYQRRDQDGTENSPRRTEVSAQEPGGLFVGSSIAADHPIESHVPAIQSLLETDLPNIVDTEALYIDKLQQCCTSRASLPTS